MKKIKIFLTLFFITTLIFFIFSFIDGYFSERVKTYIEQKTYLYTTDMIEKTIKEKVAPLIDNEKMVLTSEKGITINTSQVNYILGVVNESLSNDINYIKDNGFEELTLPIGIILSETLFASSDLKIKININVMGSVRSDVVSVVEEYGINNSLFKVEIVSKVELETLIPFTKQKVEVITRIPLFVGIFQGEVPRYYSYGKTENPLIAVD